MVYLPTIPLSEVGAIARRKYLPDSIKCRASGSINVSALYDLARVVVTVIMKIIGEMILEKSKLIAMRGILGWIKYRCVVRNTF